MREDYIEEIRRTEQQRRKKIWLYGTITSVIIMAVIGLSLWNDSIRNSQEDTNFHTLNNQIYKYVTIIDSLETKILQLQQDKISSSEIDSLAMKSNLIHREKQLLSLLSDKDKEIKVLKKRIKRLERAYNETSNTTDKEKDPPPPPPPPKKTDSDTYKDIKNYKHVVVFKDSALKDLVEKDFKRKAKSQKQYSSQNIELESWKRGEHQFKPNRPLDELCIYYAETTDLKTVVAIQKSLYFNAKDKSVVNIKRVKSTGEGNPIIVY